MNEPVDGVRARFDLVSELQLGEFSRSAYQSMLSQRGRIITRPFYADGWFTLPPFSIPLAERRLLQMLGSKRDRHLVEHAGKWNTFDGMSARDGSESYQLNSVDCLFEEHSSAPSARTPSPRPMNFMFYFDIEVGAPIPETFAMSVPPNPRPRRYWGSLQVVWSSVWKFFVAPTRRFADELRQTVQANHGFDIGQPPYTVSERRD